MASSSDLRKNVKYDPKQSAMVTRMATIYGNTLSPSTTGGNVTVNNVIVRPATAISRLAAPQTIANSTATKVIFDTEVLDQNGMIDIAGNPTRITFPTIGVYYVCAVVAFTANATGYRLVELLFNNTTSIGTASIQGFVGITNWITTACVIQTTLVTDYIEVRVTQTSGGNLDILSGTPTRFSATKVFG